MNFLSVVNRALPRVACVSFPDINQQKRTVARYLSREAVHASAAAEVRTGVATE